MRKPIILVLSALLAIAATLSAVAFAGSSSEKGRTDPFKRAQLRVEVNSSAGDAGIQLDMDHDPWKSITLKGPTGAIILDVSTRGVLQGYGLTELFSESSEPPFEKFPLSEFKKLFPAGSYTLTGVTVDGARLKSTITLTHDFPAGANITAPLTGSTVPRAGLVARWDAVTTPAGIDIVAYQVLAVSDALPTRTFSVHLPGSARSVSVPAEFLVPGGYKIEVLAIEVSGNQTLSEVAFTVQ